MIVNTISEARAQLSALIERVREGEEVILGKAGKPVAVLVAYRDYPKKRKPGALRGKIRVAADFDDLPDNIADAFGAPRDRAGITHGTLGDEGEMRTYQHQDLILSLFSDE